MPAEEPNLDTVEGWTNLIGNKSKEALEPLQSEINKMKQTQKAKAIRVFMERHPEYDEDKLNPILDKYDRVKSRSDIDHDEILEDLEDAWAVENRGKLVQKAKELRQAALKNDQDVAGYADTSVLSSDRNDQISNNATPSDIRIAKSTGMDLDKYLKLKRQLEESKI
jgi:hypothetical protein